jgi:hypothetical protein
MDQPRAPLPCGTGKPPGPGVVALDVLPLASRSAMAASGTRVQTCPHRQERDARIGLEPKMATDSLHWDRVWGRARLLGEGFDKARIAHFYTDPPRLPKPHSASWLSYHGYQSLIQPPGWANAAHWASSAVAVHWPTRAATADLPLVRYLMLTSTPPHRSVIMDDCCRHRGANRRCS